MKIGLSAIRFATVAGWLVSAVNVSACPFCTAESQTLSEETRSADAVVLAKLVKEAAPISNSSDPNTGTATFRIAEVLRGKDVLSDAKDIGVVFFGDSDRERTFLISGIGKEKVDWTTPLPLSTAAVDYVRQLANVAPSGPDRLAFFQEYLENDDPLLAQDAYDEFARAPYSELHELKPRMKHDRLVKWVADPEVSPSRRRLYLTMLGVCGSKDDLPLLESMIVSDFEVMKPALEQLVYTGLSIGGPIGLPVWIEAVQQEERRKKLGLDALVACYLILRGPDGLDLIENRFLKNPHAEYTYIYSTIMALRFHGDENTGILPRERLLASMRLLLDNPDFADQVILDLSRWEDWSVLDRLVEMFKKSDEKGYVRQPVVSYLTVASDQPGEVGMRAKAAMAELEKLDPETVKTARSLMAFGALSRARGVASAASATAAKSGEAATSTALDTTQAFAASPEDEKTDTSTIPDPANFEQGKQDDKSANDAGGTNAVAASEVNRTTAAKVPVAGPAAADANSSPATSSPASSLAAPASPPTEVNPILVAGLPLAAAALLMGVYWLILRAGAV